MRAHHFDKHLPLVTILIFASVLRLLNLTSSPPGMPFEEIAQAETSLGGVSSWVMSPPVTAVFSAIQSISLSFAGHNLIGIRLTSALCSLLVIAFTYAWTRRAYGLDIALIASAFLAVSFWPLVLGRIGLDASLIAMMSALVCWLACHVFRRRAKILIGVLLSAFLLILMVSWHVADADTWLAGAGRAALLWTHRGDPFFHLNVGELPVFNIGLALVFIIGLLAAPPNHLGWVRSLPFLWIVFGLLNASLTKPEQGFLSASVALPATYVALALGFSFLGRLIAERLKAAGWQPIVMLVIILFAGLEASWRAFYIGPVDPQARHDFNTDFYRIAEWLETQPPDTRVAVATTDPHRIPPAMIEFVSDRQREIVWFDPSLALAIPPRESAQVIITSGAVVSSRFDTLLDEAVSVRDEHYPSGDKMYTLYALLPANSLASQLDLGEKHAWVSDAQAFLPDDPEGVRRPVSFPVLFGDILELVGYRGPVSRQTGQNLPITMLWSVKRAADPGESLSIFAHLLSADGQLVAQRDLLAVPPSAWQPGDSFIQLQDISLESVAPGKYTLEIGVYIIDGARFPVMLNDAPAGDRLLLEPIEVTP